jgi:hypothetical protein
MFLKNHLLPCSSWIVKIHHVHEFSFCLMFLKNISLAFGSWIFILLNFWKITLLSHELWFVWCSWKILICLDNLDSCFSKSIQLFGSNFWFWSVLLRITLTWLLMLNNANVIFLKIMSQLLLWVLRGLHCAFENHFPFVWINFVEKISWSWESWAINLLNTNYHSLWLMESCENKIMFLKFIWWLMN